MRLEPTHRWSDAKIALFLLTPDKVSDSYVRWLNDPAINLYLESRFVRQDRAGVAAFVAGILASDRDLFFGILDKDLDRHVGNIKLGPINRHHGLGEIGIMIGDRSAWGRGVGSRAIDRVAVVARDELGLRRLTAGCYASNVGSARAFEKAGFTVEAVRPAHFLLEGRPEDAVLLGRMLDQDGKE
jgi:ribosomal-protein-alanine N-acetyltransferase